MKPPTAPKRRHKIIMVMVCDSQGGIILMDYATAENCPTRYFEEPLTIGRPVLMVFSRCTAENAVVTHLTDYMHHKH